MDNLAYENEFDGSLGGVLNKKSKTIVENNRTKSNVEDVKVYKFEEAVTLTEIGKYHYFLQIVCGICLMSATVEIMCVSVIMPFINRDIPSTVAEQGFLASASFLGIVMSSHTVGFLSDTWGRVKILRSTLTLSFVTSTISAFSVNIWMLIAFRFLTGLIISACQGCIFSYVGEFHSKKTRTKFITMFSMFVPLGLVVMPALAIAILPLKLNATVFGMNFTSWRLLLLANTPFRIISIIGLFIMPESPKYVLMQGGHEQALKTLRKMFSINTGRPENDYPVQKVSFEISGGKLNNVSGVRDAIKLVWIQTVPLFYKDRVLHTLNLSVIFFIMAGIAQGLFMWFPTILKNLVANEDIGYTTCEIMKLSRNISGNITTVDEGADGDVPDITMFPILIIIGAVFCVSYFTFSLIIDRIGKRNLLFAWIIVSGCSCLILTMVTSFKWSVVVFTLITSLNSCIGIVSTVAMEFFPTNISAMGMCLVMMIARIGSVAGSNFVGLMLHMNCDIMLYIYFALCVLIGALSLVLP